jgi:hypothetical protein
MATRSAHVPTGYAAFSTLPPVMMVGDASLDDDDSKRRSDAPTRNSE